MGRKTERVRRFEYLGSVITSDEKADEEINAREQKQIKYTTRLLILLWVRKKSSYEYTRRFSYPHYCMTPKTSP